MKKTMKYLGLTLLSVFAIASCAKEQVNPDQPQPAPSGEMAISATATAEDATTASTSKTAISDGTGSTKVVTWVANDAINVIYGTDAKDRVSATTKTGGAEASFSFEVPSGLKTFTAVNPASATASLDAQGKINLEIPAVQTGAFADGNLSVSRVAVAPSVTFAFKNMTSFFKVTSTDAEITKFVLTAKGGEAIAGTLPVSFDAQNVPTPEIASVANPASVITTNVSAAGTFYIAVVPGVTYTKGVSLDVYKGENIATTYDYETETALTLGRSNIANFGTVTIEFIGEGLTGLYATATGGTGKYYTTKAFPYQKGDPIEVHIPGATAAMLQNVTMHPTLDPVNTIYPALPVDFTQAYKMMIRDAKGHCYSHMLSINTKKAKITKEWEKNATETHVGWYNRMRLAVDKDYVYILDAVQNYCNGIQVLNRSTGDFVKTMSAPYQSQYVSLGDINVDDAGNLIVSRYNFAYGCGFLAHYYKPSDASWNCCVYYADGNVPTCIGENATIVGNAVTGEAYMYATAPSLNKIYVWKITNGASSTYSTIDYTSELSTAWNSAIVHRVSMDASSPIYVGANVGSTELSAFVHELNTTNKMLGSNSFGPRILNFKPFTVNNEEYLAILYQWSSESWATAFMSIFNITDRDRWTMVSGAERFNLDFGVAKSDGFGGTNYDHSGGLDIYQDGETTYFYFGVPAKGSGDAAYDAANTKVVCYKMIFE